MDGTQPALVLACCQPADRQWRTRHSCAQARTRSTFPLVLRRCHSLGAGSCLASRCRSFCALCLLRGAPPSSTAWWPRPCLHSGSLRGPPRQKYERTRQQKCCAAWPLGGENELRALAAGAGLSPAALAAALAAPGLEAGGAGSTPAAFPGGSAAQAPAQPRRFRGHDDACVPLRVPYRFQPARGATGISFHALPHMFVA